MSTIFHEKGSQPNTGIVQTDSRRGQGGGGSSRTDAMSSMNKNEQTLAKPRARLNKPRFRARPNRPKPYPETHQTDPSQILRKTENTQTTGQTE